MTKLHTKIISILMALIIAFSFPFSSLAASASDPYAEHGLCIIEFALDEVGITETGDNITKYNDWIGIQGGWYAVFISWCANQAGISETIIPKTGDPYALRTHFTTNGRYYPSSYHGGTAEPQIGDICFYSDVDHYPALTHVAIVVDVDSTYIHTVDGNWGDKVSLRSPALPKKQSVHFRVWPPRLHHGS